MPTEKPLAVTMGDPAGIGGELTVMAWTRRGDGIVPPFYAIDDPMRLAAIGDALGTPCPVVTITDPADAPAFACAAGALSFLPSTFGPATSTIVAHESVQAQTNTASSEHRSGATANPVRSSYCCLGDDRGVAPTGPVGGIRVRSA